MKNNTCMMIMVSSLMFVTSWGCWTGPRAGTTAAIFMSGVALGVGIAALGTGIIFMQITRKESKDVDNRKT